ncbi:MAG: class I SAM-dependent methyltransferase, partial [Chloroflexota bacterium]
MAGKILQEQLAYYRARAAEYDEWFYRQGRYDRGEIANAHWAGEIETVKADLKQFNPSGDILELAAGTGIWTEALAMYSRQITCVDASAEMLTIHRAKLQNPHIQYIEADLFNWQPTMQYDVVFFAFWLSHVPPEKLTAFLGTVREAMKPDGRFFMLDSQRTQLGTSS